MEYSEKPEWNSISSINPPDERIRQRVRDNWDAVAKPLDGLGRFEELTAQIGAITGDETIEISRRAVLILCADNGIVEEKISQSGQEVTAAVARAMGEGRSSVGRMSAGFGVDTIPVDIGINAPEKIPQVLDRRIRPGTRNFRKEPAMTGEETQAAIRTGIELVRECKAKGYRILATGEMGIGNTTTSSAVAASLLGCSAELVTGRGAGLDDQSLERKRQVIAEAIGRYGLYKADPFTVLQSVGGLDIAGLAGVCIGGALFHVPVVLDGVISLCAALTAERLVPGCRAYLLASHRGKEPAADLLLRELSLSPVIDAQLALGEGTGAVMLFPLLDMAVSVYRSGTTFERMQVEQYRRLSQETERGER